MTVPILPDISPSRSTRQSVRQPVKSLRFGGGHTLYLRHGQLGADVKWSVYWAGLSRADALSLLNFFDARQGTEVFFWTPPEDDKPLRFICMEWSAVPLTGGYQNITATFIKRPI